MSDSNKPILASDAKKLKNRGKGVMKKYSPFIFVHEISSRGESYRIRSSTVGRIHHLLSRIELGAFLIFDRHPEVIDIREQYPIQIEDSLEICRQLGIKHPNISGKLTVVSTDLLLNFQDTKQIAVAIKPWKHLTDKRVIEKLQIEKAYWEQKGCEWKLFTDRQITPALKENLEWLHPVLNYENNQNIDDFPLNEIHKTVERILTQKDKNINKVCAELDDAYHMPSGSHISEFRIAVAKCIVSTPINEPFHSWGTKQVSLVNSNVIAWRSHAS